VQVDVAGGYRHGIDDADVVGGRDGEAVDDVAIVGAEAGAVDRYRFVAAGGAVESDYAAVLMQGKREREILIVGLREDAGAFLEIVNCPTTSAWPMEWTIPVGPLTPSSIDGNNRITRFAGIVP
jgi:hypothetical protein